MTGDQKKVWLSRAKHLNAGGTCFTDVWMTKKKNFAEMCLALAPSISALEMVAIYDAAFDYANTVPFHKKWNATYLVKHFK